MSKHLFGFSMAGFASIGGTQAQDLRPLCADRPGLDTPACTVDPGHAAAELALIDWSLDHRTAQRTDSWIAGNLLIRYGVTSNMEIEIGWTALGAVRAHNRIAGPTTQARAGLSIAWQPQRDLQLAMGAVAGLNADSPDMELYMGIVRRF